MASLTSDGMSRARFLPLWRDAMWATAAMNERARLLLELGRASVREEGKASPLVVAVADAHEPPLVVMPLADAPSRRQTEVREAITARLVELGAREVYVLMTTRGGGRDGVPSFLLAAWGESRQGEEACVVMPFRWVSKGLEEAEPLVAPDAGATAFSRELAGLLVHTH